MATMLKRFINLSRIILRVSPNRKKIKDDPMSIADVNLQQMHMNVRIIHAGGLVELYQDAVTAFEVMEKYPGMHLSRPEVFRQPHESILHPYEKLVPGQKFYLVPSTTVRKLKRKHKKKPQETIIDTSSDETTLKKNTVNEGGDDLEDTFCSAKDFFVAREKWARYAVWKCDREVKKPFRPPIRKPRMWKGLGWQPSLTAIKELSP